MIILRADLEGASVSMGAVSFRNQKGITFYQIFIDLNDEDIERVRFPNEGVMKRLARKFLHCKYDEPYRRTGKNTLVFMIDSKIAKEDRMAFLGGFCTHVALVRKKPVE